MKPEIVGADNGRPGLALRPYYEETNNGDNTTMPSRSHHRRKNPITTGGIVRIVVDISAYAAVSLASASGAGRFIFARFLVWIWTQFVVACYESLPT
jgi:hypothetical protein